MNDEMMTFETVGSHEVLSQVAAMLAELHTAVPLSKWDCCIAMANAIGFILADAAHSPKGTRSLPKDKAFERIATLQTVMTSAYELRTVMGES